MNAAICFDDKPFAICEVLSVPSCGDVRALILDVAMLNNWPVLKAAKSVVVSAAIWFDESCAISEEDNPALVCAVVNALICAVVKPLMLEVEMAAI